MVQIPPVRSASCRTAIAVVVALGAVATSAGAQDFQTPSDFAELAAQRLPAVVNVSTTQNVEAETMPQLPGMPEIPPGSPFEEFFRDYFGGPGQPGQPGQPGPLQPQARPITALGSGFIIDESGYVVTNNHVIEGADEIQIILQDDTELDAEVIGHDPRTDIALLKVESDQPLPAVDWGDSDAARVGEWVVAIGNPFGLGGTVTTGIISAKTRNINAGPYDDFIQTDAAINRGNSGGPLFNTQGQVIGVNTAIFSPSGGSVGIGFAVPSAVAQAVVADLMDDGRVERGWLGVSVQPVTPEIAEALRLEEPRGALVANVGEDSPAEEAGIEPGDVILSVNGTPIDDGRELARVVAETEVGTEAEVAVWRSGEEVVLPTEIGLLEDELVAAAGSSGDTEGTRGSVELLGMSLAPATPELRAQFGIEDDVEGVVVTDVAPDSPAAEEGISPGDVIVEAGQQQVEEPQQVAEAIETAREEGRNSILLLRQRDEVAGFVALPVVPENERG